MIKFKDAETEKIKKFVLTLRCCEKGYYELSPLLFNEEKTVCVVSLLNGGCFSPNSNLYLIYKNRGYRHVQIKHHMAKFPTGFIAKGIVADKDAFEISFDTGNKYETMTKKVQIKAVTNYVVSVM